jgi:8-oxo-dGTP diphosphatase
MIRVTCAIIRNDENEVLIVQRGDGKDHPFKWEFPGGKLKDGETDEECIIREIREELSMEIVICGRLDPVEHDYGHKKIKLLPFLCDTLDELPLLSEHVDFRWIAAENLNSIDFTEADLFVVRLYLDSVNKLTDGEEKNSEADQSSATDLELQKMINGMMSLQEAEWFATSAMDNPAIFLKLLEYSYKPDRKLAFRASWTLSKVFDRYPAMINPHLPGIVERLNLIDNESTQRSFLRIISLTDLRQLSLKHHGILADHCFRALNSGFSAIAIKAYSMEIIYRLALIYPELANELAASISMLQGEGSAGVIARGRIILKKLAEITSDSGSTQP